MTNRPNKDRTKDQTKNRAKDQNKDRTKDQNKEKAKPDDAASNLELKQVIAEGQTANSSLKSVFHELEAKLSSIPEDKAVLILQEVTKLIETASASKTANSNDVLGTINDNIRSSIEAVIITELEDWIRNRLPTVFSETIASQMPSSQLSEDESTPDNDADK